jgi:hypothetical protein
LGDEKRGDLFVRPQFLENRRNIEERRRTKVGTMRLAEKYQIGASGKIGICKIPLKNLENEGRQKIGVWSCRADSATRCHRQFTTAAAHRKVSLSAEPVALSS